MQTLSTILVQHPFFQDLQPQHVCLICGCAANVRFKAGEFLCREGEEANRFYLIRHGKVALQVFVPGRGAMSIETMGAGEVIGWSWLFPPYRWHFDVQALALTRATAFDGRCLRDKCEDDPALGYAMMQRFARVMMQRLQATRLQLLDVYGVPA